MKEDKIITRIARIKGQLDGIEKMYKGKRSCLEIVQQVSAIRSALAGLAREILTDETVSCLKENKEDQIREMLKKISSF